MSDIKKVVLYAEVLPITKKAVKLFMVQNDLNNLGESLDRIIKNIEILYKKEEET